MYCSYDFHDEETQKKYISTCEDEFTATLERVVDKVLSRKEIRYITLSGPTCSGKTTTAGFLIDRLGSAGKSVKVISIDDYYYDRSVLVENARLAGTEIDLDSVKTIDLDELKKAVLGIESMTPFDVPKFDFTEGERVGYRHIVPKKEDIFLFEGIQGVYPEVSALFEAEHLLKVFISVEDPIETPYGNWRPDEIRLMRRIVRDCRIRNTDAEDTLRHWGGVRNNEKKNIEPYKNGSDIMIDSGLNYEIALLKIPLLEQLELIKEDSPFYDEARDLMKRLEGYPIIEISMVPRGSVMKEFVG